MQHQSGWEDNKKQWRTGLQFKVKLREEESATLMVKRKIKVEED